MATDPPVSPICAKTRLEETQQDDMDTDSLSDLSFVVPHPLLPAAYVTTTHAIPAFPASPSPQDLSARPNFTPRASGSWVSPFSLTRTLSVATESPTRSSCAHQPRLPSLRKEQSDVAQSTEDEAFLLPNLPTTRQASQQENPRVSFSQIRVRISVFAYAAS